MFENTFTKNNKYAINKKFQNFYDISFRELFGRITGFFFLTI